MKGNPIPPNVLTGVPLGEWAAPQKAAWCRNNLGMEGSTHVDISRSPSDVPPSDPRLSQAEEGSLIITSATRDKRHMSGKNCVLIDDRRDLGEWWGPHSCRHG